MSLLGISLTADEIVGAASFHRHLPCRAQDDQTILVDPPSFRVDIEREADLIEEVARLYGYNKIPITLPKVDLSYPEQDKQR